METARLIAEEQDPARAQAMLDNYILMTAWLEERTDFPGGFFIDLIGLFRENKFVKKQISVKTGIGTILADPDNVTTPMFSLCAKHDDIVTGDQNETPDKIFPNSARTEHKVYDCGHVGLVSSTKINKLVFGDLKKWLDEYSTPLRPQTATAPAKA